MTGKKIPGFFVCAAVILVSCGPAPADAPRNVSQPNILLIITDQQQAGMMGCAGNPWVKTPNLDRLAAGGTRFEKAYATNPVCIPSRFSLFTGRMPSAIGMEDNKDVHNPVPPAILDDAMGAVFSAAGYHTAYAGKVHLPGGPGVCDNVAAYGFQERLAPRDNEGRDPAVDACVDFLKAPREKPFLLVASLINPHDICYLPLRDSVNALPSAEERAALMQQQGATELPFAELDAAMRLPPGIDELEFYRKHCPALPGNHAVPEKELTAYMATHATDYLGWARRNYNERQWLMFRWVYARLTERVDAQIGRILDALQSAGLEENTLVVFTSDHGEQNGAHCAACKGFLYEESVRIPFLVKWKGVTKPGQVDASHLVSNGLDLIPTLCDFSGVPVPPALRGRSVRPLTEGRPPRDWRSTLVVENNSSRLVRFANWKYIVGNPDSVAAEMLKKLSNAHPVREVLINLDTDAGEMNNLADSQPDNAHILEGRRLLKDWYEAQDLQLDPHYVVKQ